MNQLLETQPSRELKFTFEAKKQSTCNVQLINKTDQHVAFKVKTTSPKKYCVRPNVGVVLPEKTREFVVLMQAQREPPPDMISKDKFLIQSTIVPAGTMEEDVTSDMFSREPGKYIEERKLKVVLLSPPHSLELASENGKLEQDPALESQVAEDELLIRTERYSIIRDADLDHSTELEKVNTEVPKPIGDARGVDVTGLEIESKEVQKPMVEARLEAIKNFKAELTKAAEPVINRRDVESRPTEAVESNSGVILEARALKGMESRMGKEADGLRLAKDVEIMKSKMLGLEWKLGQAEKTISKLMEERGSSIQERKLLHQDLALLRIQKVQKTIHEGFPILFVCMVAMISLVIGYLLHT